MATIDHHHHDHDHDHDHDVVESIGAPTDPAQESLTDALKTGFNLLRVMMLVLVVAYLFSGWFRVGPGQQGLIVRFGELRENGSNDSVIFEQGSHPTLPDPFEQKILISGETTPLEVDTFVFVRSPDMMGKPLYDVLPTREQIDPKIDGSMLTGDRNLAHGLWTVEYRIRDAGQFVRNIGDTREQGAALLGRLLEASVVRTVAGLSIERITVQRDTGVAADFTEAVRRRLELALAPFETGIEVVKVTAETVEPGSVRGAFLDVTRAQSERKRIIGQAQNERVRLLSATAGVEEQYTRVLDSIDDYGASQIAEASADEIAARRDAINASLEAAGGTVAAQLQVARSRAAELRQEVEQEYAAFVEWNKQFQEYPREVAAQLWTEMRSSILANKENELFFVPQSGVIEIQTNRDDEKLIERDLERFKNRQQRPRQ